MAAKILKYNPSFLNDQELIEAFVVRHTTLALVLEVIRDNTHETNQHLLVLGPRGSGKTSLLLRVAAEIRQSTEMNDLWFPLPFGEESYEVTSAGEFWLEAIHYLGVQTGDSSWDSTYAELLQEPDERRLGQRCLARLLDFADSRGQKLLLLVENLNLLFGEQLSDDDAWSLRDTLMHESRLMLLGSATSRFDVITDQNKAMFELFRLIELSRLSIEECQKVWHRVAGQEITREQARAVQILTGGNPRLLTILAAFGANRSFRSLLEDLSLMVDEHTDYFKSNFENLPPAERKVFACLATLWEDSLASDVARAARMTTSKVSALLKRLESRGAVTTVLIKAGKKRYQLTERLYNIYYLMRRGLQGGRVRAVVQFMLQYYGKERLHEAAALIAREACSLDMSKRQEHYQALRFLCVAPEARDMMERIRGELPPAFFHLSDVPADLKTLNTYGEKELFPEIEEVRSEVKDALQNLHGKDGVNTLREIVKFVPKFAWAWARLGEVLVDEFDKIEEGTEYLRKAVELDPEMAWAWANLGEVLAYKLNEPEKGAEYVRKAIELDPTSEWAWASLGKILAYKLDLADEGVNCLREAVKLDPKYEGAWANLGNILVYKLGEPKEGAVCLRKALELDAQHVWSWLNLGETLAEDLGEPEKGMDCLRKVVELDPKNKWGWGHLGKTLGYHLNQPEEAAECLRKAVELDSKFDLAWASLGEILAAKLDQPEEGAKCLRRAVELNPENSWAWAGLGGVLILLDHPKEGAECLRKALELDPKDAWAYVGLGLALANQLGQPEEGAKYLRKAVELNPNDSFACSVLGCIFLFDLENPEEGLDCIAKAASLDPAMEGSIYLHNKIQTGMIPNDVIEVILLKIKRQAGWLNNIASALMDGENYENLEKIEFWAREAVEQKEDEPSYNGTLARALALRGSISESLTHASILFQHPELVRLDVQESTDILTIAAALGHGQEALDLLLASASLDVLEPVAAGLKQYLGLDLHAPQEVKEIADDIVRRIEYWKKWHA